VRSSGNSSFSTSIDPSHLAPGSLGAGRVGVRQRVAEPVTCRIGVTLDDDHALAHDRCPD
jgi:hypothetical protein